ncbi:hypothetical protein ANCCAN_08174 [Ancylostoma caninum]|uniref:Uncharacterized protein n=1 Tax=Ancylostoma caninum TaxID=29170 RepID=A0A368GS18_ANCCA|nr:hypothetical protein ANCCAN_08174 [Ancylostoma caninum]
MKVIRKHIESTILHEISHVLPVPDGFDKDEDEDSESSDRVENGLAAENVPILQECDDKSTMQESVTTITYLTGRNSGPTIALHTESDEVVNILLIPMFISKSFTLR